MVSTVTQDGVAFIIPSTFAVAGVMIGVWGLGMEGPSHLLCGVHTLVIKTDAQTASEQTSNMVFPSNGVEDSPLILLQ
jgi:hypothetical protein